MEYRLIIRYFLYSILLIFLQIFLFNFVQIGTGFFPYVYVLIIMLLPIEINKIIPLFFAFGFGFLIDLMNDTVAINTGAMVLVGFSRPFVLKILTPSDGYEPGKLPSIFNYGFRWFAVYMIILLFFHQFIVNFLDIFTFKKIGVIIFKTLINTLYSAIYIVILHLLIFRNRK